MKRPIYESIIRPNEKKIIWYRKMPEIAATTKVGDSKEPRGEQKSETTQIALSKAPKSFKQLVLQPAPEIKLERDVTAPNLIGLAPPMPPAPAPRTLKRFVAPPQPVKPKAPEPVLMEPDITVQWTETGGVEHTLSLLRPKRAFVAPPRADASRSAKPVVLESAPELGSGGATQVAKLPGLGTPKTPARRFTPPSGNESSGPGGGSGLALDRPPDLQRGSNVNAVIVGLSPSDRIDGLIPPGSRPAQFSTAPKVGKTATGDVSGTGAAAVPGLVVRDRDPKSESVSPGPPPKPAPPRSRTVLYGDLVPGSVRPALSAPLRPSSRTIPRALEARFQGRLVYTIVIPAPNLPAYTGDWIVWFAEQTQKPGEVPRMRAPVPLQKIEPLDTGQTTSADRPEARIQLAAIIKSNGQFDAVTIVRGPATPASQSAIEDLKRWEFRPAVRDGSPIDVEVVIEIPFSLAWLNGSL